MKQAGNVMGFEFVCRAMDCAYNDRPACTEHTERSPVVIGPGGRCLRYKMKDETGDSED